MQIWPKRYAMARVLSLGLFLVLVYNQSNETVCHRSPKRFKEDVLKLDLFEMRRAIDAYAKDYQQPPQALSELIDHAYLRDIFDPITGKKDWITQRGLVPLDSGRSVMGIANVHSASPRINSAGSFYNSW
jgi:general secretion pathway protein G